MITDFEKKVYSLVKRVPKGKVTTYKEVAIKLGSSAYQAIGNALRKNPFAPDVPCHRVIRSNGTVGGFMGKTSGLECDKKVSLLESEGVIVKEGIVNLNQFLFRF